MDLNTRCQFYFITFWFWSNSASVLRRILCHLVWSFEARDGSVCWKAEWFCYQLSRILCLWRYFITSLFEQCLWERMRVPWSQKWHCKLLLQTSGNTNLLHREETGLPVKVLGSFHISSKPCRLLLRLLVLLQPQKLYLNIPFYYCK